MTTVTLSPKFQIVIPKATRDKFRLKAGMKLVVLEYDKVIRIVPLRSMKELKGSLRGTMTPFNRESDRNL